MSQFSLFVTVYFIASTLHDCDGYTDFSAQSIRAKFKMLIQDLYYDAEAKLKKISFIKKWAYHGDPTPARVAELIFNTKALYSRMVKLYLASVDKIYAKYYLTHYQAMERLFILKRIGITVEHMVHIVTEYDKYDPSGKLFGRSGPEDASIPPEIHNDSNFKLPEHKIDQMKPAIDEKVANMKQHLIKKLRNWAKMKGYNDTNLMSYLHPKNKLDDGFDSDKDLT